MKRKFAAILSAATLAACFTGCMSKEAKSAQEKIDRLPDNYSEDILSDLENASEAYQSLSGEDKKQVDDDRIDDLYEQYYKSISDEANKKISDLNPENYSTIEKYNDGLNEFNQIVEFISTADSKAYLEIDFSMLRSKLSTYKGYLVDFANEIRAVDTAINNTETNLQTIADNYSNYSMVSSFCGTIIYEMEGLSVEYVNKSDFLTKVKALEDFTSSNTYSDSNSMEFVDKYNAVADTYNAMVEEVNLYYEQMDLDSFESQTDELLENMDKVNVVIDNVNESYNE